MTSPARFVGKVALVSGAASGIGRAVVLRLAREGASVLGIDVNEVGLAAVAAEAADAGGVVETQVVDVSSREQCGAAVAYCVERFGGIDVLGNVAGIAWAAHTVDVTEDAYRRMMGINVDGYFFLAQATIPSLLERSGCIINIASNAGLEGLAYGAVYCMTKGAVVQLTRALAMEFIKTPLRVNAIAPGGVQTALVAGYQMPADVDLDLIARYVGLRPPAEASEIAHLFAFLASDEAANIHGAVITSDGGLTTG